MSGGAEIDRMIDLLAKLPGLGPRSARRFPAKGDTTIIQRAVHAMDLSRI